MLLNNAPIDRRKFLSFLPISLGVLNSFVKQPVKQSVHRWSLTDRLNSPAPKFQLGQFVSHDYKVDDDIDPRHGQTFTDVGLVTGVVFNPPDWSEEGWVYFVKWVRYESWLRDPELYIGHIDEVHETDLHETDLRLLSRLESSAAFTF